MWKRLLMLTALMTASLGCIEIKGKHTLYLAPDRSVTWTVLEEEIRFDGDTRDARKRQQEEFLDSVASSENDAALALGALYPRTLNSRILREETPQAIFTEARFPAIDRVYRYLFDLYKVQATVELETEGNLTRLLITLWPVDFDEDDFDENDQVEEFFVEYLFASLSECRIVLTEGKFVDAVGFEIVDGGGVVKPAEDDSEEEQGDDSPLILSLTWTTERES